MTTTKDKVTRFLRLSAKFEAGQGFLRRGATEDLVDQLLLVPDADHDDLVDALDFAVSDAMAGYMGSGLGLGRLMLYTRRPVRWSTDDR